MSEEVKSYLSKHGIPQVMENMASMLIKEVPEKPLDAMANWLALQGGLGTDVYNLRTKARIASLAPAATQVEAGKTYYWCTCGYSKNQPFCDGSHVKMNEKNGAKLTPLPFTATEAKTVYFCNCKATKNPPMCDGSHAKLHSVKLHIFPVSNSSMSVLLLARDCNLPVDVVNVPVGEHNGEDFLKRFPLGQVPALTDPGAVVSSNGSTSDFHTYESCSILRYLANKYRLGAPWYPSDPVGRNRVDRILDWRNTELAPAITGVAYPFLGWAEQNEAAITKATAALTCACEVFTSRLLEGQPFIGGSQPCLADYAIVPGLAYTAANKAYKLPPAMVAYWDRFKQASLCYEEVMAALTAFASK